MSLQNKINEELGVLQQELSRLSNYTTEIGKAKQTAEAATTASEQILETGSSMVQAFQELKIQSDKLTKEAKEVLSAIKSAQLVERMAAIEQQGKELEDSIRGLYQRLSSIKLLLFVMMGLVMISIVALSFLARAL